MRSGEIQVDYCPVSQSIDLLGDRWTLGVVFHVLLGRRRFSELRDVMPRIPPATLSKRLKLLVRAEIITRTTTDDGRIEYAPTHAGAELYKVMYGLGVWGERWIREIITDDAVDPAKIMWEMRRALDLGRMPTERVVVHFEFVGSPPEKSHFWMVLDRDAPDLCVVDPGFGDDLVVRSRPGPIGAMWMGDRSLGDLVSDGTIIVTGLPRLARKLPAWIGTSVFADVESAGERHRHVPVASVAP
ncbi:MAG: winged helix-turn-helix transcriptional regulator [Acidimicrobiales bacterium]